MRTEQYAHFRTRRLVVSFETLSTLVLVVPNLAHRKFISIKKRGGRMTQSSTTIPEDTVILEEMFVQIARTVTSDKTTLTLQDVSPSTLYFSDRPERVVGHMTTEQFVEQWTEGPNSFFEDPPNAVLAYVGAGEDLPSDAVVVLRDPVASGSSLSYSIEVLEGTVPAESGAVTLFIDPLGRPLSPVSLAGMNRRDRRRDRRR